MTGDELDKYGNPVSGDRIIYCCFPDCGCDGSRLCCAENGPHSGSVALNFELRKRSVDELISKGVV